MFLWLMGLFSSDYDISARVLKRKTGISYAEYCIAIDKQTVLKYTILIIFSQ